MGLLDRIYFYFLVIKEIFGIIFNNRRKCESNARLDGKVVVITGANTGIGKETALQLSLRGAKVIIGCRDMKKGKEALNDIKLKIKNENIVLIQLDLSSLESVRDFAKNVSEQESKLDILINNAGVMMCPEWKTKDGFEMHFGSNHLGHFLLTLSLLPLLKKSQKARIVTVSALYYYITKIHFENINLRNNAYKPNIGYAQSKLANILFSRELSRRLGKNSGITTYSLHPGIVYSEIGRHLSKFSIFNIFKIISLNVCMGSQTTLYCAIDESLENETGFYYENCRRINEKCMSKNATDGESARKLWELSSDLVKLENHLRV